MGAAHILAILALVEALVPTINLIAQELGKSEDEAKELTIQDLLDLRKRLEASDPTNWPDLQFKSGKD